MAEVEAPEGAGEQTNNAAAGTTAETGLRRLHRLAGVFALGAFVVEHLVVQASALGGSATYDAVAGALMRSPFAAGFELVFVGLPLTFHAGYGLVLARHSAASPAEIERYGSRRGWIAQRLSAAVLAVFMLGHLWELRFQRLFFGLSSAAIHTTVSAHLSSTLAGFPWAAVLYLFGIFAAVFHIANGLFGATAALGVATSPTGRARTRLVTTAFGVILFLLGAGAVMAFATGTRLLSGAGGDSPPLGAPCGTDAPRSGSPSR